MKVGGFFNLALILQDLKFALRQLHKHAAFSAVVILTLGLGIGANIAVFNLLNVVILRKLPVERAEELVRVAPISERGEDLGFTYDLFDQFQRVQRIFAECYGASYPATMELGIGPNSKNINVQFVSGNFFSVLRVSPYLGRVFNREDDERGNLVGVLSYHLWTKTFNGDPQILGQTLYVDRQPITVVGVAPPRFFGDVVSENTDLWVPLKLHSQMYRVMGFSKHSASIAFIHVIGRAQPHLHESEMKASLAVSLKQLLGDGGERKGVLRELERFDLLPAEKGLSQIRDRFSQPLLALMILVGLLLILTCSNIANLLLARSLARRREFSTRLAIGATMRQLMRQLLIEHMVLSLLGGLIGFLAGFWISSLLCSWLIPPEAMAILDLRPDIRLLLFGFGLSLLSGLIFGLIPLSRASRLELMSGLRGGGSQRKELRVGKSLVVVQVAISFILLFEAGLMIKTLQNLEDLDLGFAREGILQIAFDSKQTGLTGEQLIPLYRDISDRINAVPGVRASSFALLNLVGGESASICCLSAQDLTSPSRVGEEVRFNMVSPRYFEAVGTRLLAGRDFDEYDLRRNDVAIINQTLAKRLFGLDNPVGQKIRYTDSSNAAVDLEVVGVVTDAKYSHIRDEATGMIFFPPTQNRQIRMRYLFVRAINDPTSLVAMALRQMLNVNSNLVVVRAETINQILDREMAQERLIAKMSGVVALLALALAAIGLYGVIFYSVNHRIHEIAIRMALGALRHQVILLVLREVFMLLVGGLIIGLLVAFSVARFVESLLYSISATNVPIMLLTMVVMAITGLVAAIAPLRRATGVQPQSALRYE